MISRLKFIVAVFFVLNAPSTIISDHIEVDCREVQCPIPELECPSDSELKSSITHSLEDEDDENDNFFDKTMLEELFPSSQLPATTVTPHVLQKRSLQHRRREAIKIVPGDYRSFEPQFFKYHNHHQANRKWKRDLVMGVQPHSEEDIKKCCPEFQCVCQTCPSVPKCEKNHVAAVVEEGHGLPGSCCPKYECVPEFQCGDVDRPKTTYWKNECLKCDCFGREELCKKLCEVDEGQSGLNCFSDYLRSPKMNGDTWLEDEDCKVCTCVDGENQCEESFCRATDCENPIKVPGKCCKICPEVTTTSTTTTSTAHPDINTTQKTPSTTIAATTSTTTATSSTTSMPTTATSPEVGDSSTTPTTTVIDIKTKPQEIGDLLEEIDIIVVLILASSILVIFTIAIGFVISQRQKKQKLMYSTIPSSESSQSSSITLA